MTRINSSSLMKLHLVDFSAKSMNVTLKMLIDELPNIISTISVSDIAYLTKNHLKGTLTPRMTHDFIKQALPKILKDVLSFYAKQAIKINLVDDNRFRQIDDAYTDMLAKKLVKIFLKDDPFATQKLSESIIDMISAIIDGFLNMKDTSAEIERAAKFIFRAIATERNAADLMKFFNLNETVMIKSPIIEIADRVAHALITQFLQAVNGVFGTGTLSDIVTSTLTSIKQGRPFPNITNGVVRHVATAFKNSIKGMKNEPPLWNLKEVMGDNYTAFIDQTTKMMRSLLNGDGRSFQIAAFELMGFAPLKLIDLAVKQGNVIDDPSKKVFENLIALMTSPFNEMLKLLNLNTEAMTRDRIITLIDKISKALIKLLVDMLPKVFGNGEAAKFLNETIHTLMSTGQLEKVYPILEKSLPLVIDEAFNVTFKDGLPLSFIDFKAMKYINVTDLEYVCNEMIEAFMRQDAIKLKTAMSKGVILISNFAMNSVLSAINPFIGSNSEISRLLVAVASGKPISELMKILNIPTHEILKMNLIQFGNYAIDNIGTVTINYFQSIGAMDALSQMLNSGLPEGEKRLIVSDFFATMKKSLPQMLTALIHRYTVEGKTISFEDLMTFMGTDRARMDKLAEETLKAIVTLNPATFMNTTMTIAAGFMNRMALKMNEVSKTPPPVNKAVEALLKSLPLADVLKALDVNVSFIMTSSLPDLGNHLGKLSTSMLFNLVSGNDSLAALMRAIITNLQSGNSSSAIGSIVRDSLTRLHTAFNELIKDASIPVNVKDIFGESTTTRMETMVKRLAKSVIHNDAYSVRKTVIETVSLMAMTGIDKVGVALSGSQEYLMAKYILYQILTSLSTDTPISQILSKFQIVVPDIMHATIVQMFSYGINAATMIQLPLDPTTHNMIRSVFSKLNETGTVFDYLQSIKPYLPQLTKVLSDMLIYQGNVVTLGNITKSVSTYFPHLIITVEKMLVPALHGNITGFLSDLVDGIAETITFSIDIVIYSNNAVHAGIKVGLNTLSALMGVTPVTKVVTNIPIQMTKSLLWLVQSGTNSILTTLKPKWYSVIWNWVFVSGGNTSLPIAYTTLSGGFPSFFKETFLPIIQRLENSNAPAFDIKLLLGKNQIHSDIMIEELAKGVVANDWRKVSTVGNNMVHLIMSTMFERANHILGKGNLIEKVIHLFKTNLTIFETMKVFDSREQDLMTRLVKDGLNNIPGWLNHIFALGSRADIYAKAAVEDGICEDIRALYVLEEQDKILPLHKKKLFDVFRFISNSPKRRALISIDRIGSMLKKDASALTLLNLQRFGNFSDNEARLLIDILGVSNVHLQEARSLPFSALTKIANIPLIVLGKETFISLGRKLCGDGKRFDGKTCAAFGGCATESLCVANARCIDIVGSFLCRCKPGFSGNGTTCYGMHFHYQVHISTMQYYICERQLAL